MSLNFPKKKIDKFKNKIHMVHFLVELLDHNRVGMDMSNHFPFEER